MRVLIVGAGLYGCEIAKSLQSLGIDFDIVDRNNDFFAESSSKNQNRLHFGGFHYSRSHITRTECRRGYDRFIEMYPEFSREVDYCYLVACKSVICFETYLAIFRHEESPFTVETLDDISARASDVCRPSADRGRVLLVKERWINFTRVRDNWLKKFEEKTKTCDIFLRKNFMFLPT